MTRKAFVVAAIILLVCGAAYAANLALERVHFSRTSYYADDDVHALRVTGILRNTSGVPYEWAEVKYGVYDARTRARVKVQKARTRDLAPGDRWQFTCETAVYISRNLKTQDRFYFKLIGVTGKQAVSKATIGKCPRCGAKLKLTINGQKVKVEAVR